MTSDCWQIGGGMAAMDYKRLTGVAFDKCLEAHYSLWNKDYTEHPLRTKCCIERCESLGLLERCKRLPVRAATLKEIQACHSERHHELLKSTQKMDEDGLRKISQQYDYIYFHQNSFENAKLALGATIDLVEEIVTEKISNGMAIVRPPGHHAMQEEFSGYCYFNNVAVTAQLMMDRHGLERIVILDWDVHHGQGTQFLFYDDPRVIYISIHRYEYGEEWPCLRESDYDFIGEGAGKGYNINLPLNEIGCGNDDFLSIFFNVILPVCSEFNPELVLVSAGYDSAIGCPEGEMSVTPACFAHFINLLSPLASGKLALLLEGGYNLKSLAESAALSLRALLGDPTPHISPISTPRISVTQSILCAVKCLHPYWKSLCYPDVVDRDKMSDRTRKMYPLVLDDPPRPGMNFYTKDNRPKMFPLLQECAGESAMDTMEDMNRQIDMLIKDTVLVRPPYKLKVSHSGMPSTACLYAGLQEHLEKRGLWSHCNIDRIKKNSHSPVCCVMESMDAVLKRECESSLVINDSHVTGSQSVMTAVKYVQECHSVKRVLVLQILDSFSSLAVTENKSGVLSISVSLPGYVRNGTSLTLDHNCSKDSFDTSSCINIPLDKNPVTDADILAAFHFIILPVSYEYCPDLVIFTWDTKTKASKSVMGIITRYLHGLADGRMLMFVNKMSHSPSLSPSSSSSSSSHSHPSSSSPGNGKVPRIEPDLDWNLATNEMKVINKCTSVLLGDKCSRLPPYHLSQRTIFEIKESMDSIKHHWKSLVYREQIPKQGS